MLDFWKGFFKGKEEKDEVLTVHRTASRMWVDKDLAIESALNELGSGQTISEETFKIIKENYERETGKTLHLSE